MTRATLNDEAALREHGYTVEPYHNGLGVPRGGGFVLRDPDGYVLMVAGHGGVSPTRWEAVAEGLRRIEGEA